MNHENILSPGLPSVTMVVLAYNQEKTIGYAVDSALAQDYEGPLTIVLSDDCSPDGTFRVMQEKAAAYKGPRRIILNRNEKNLYVAPHLYKALSLAPSDLQCKCDGDDYSAPDRVRRQVEAFCRYPSAMLCLAQMKQVRVNSLDEVPDFHKLVMNGDGKITLCTATNRDLTTVGCMTMWRPRILECTKEVLGAESRVYNEDSIMTYMAWLYGDIVMVERELVCYVRHSGNLCYCIGFSGSDPQRLSSLRNYLRFESERRKMVRASIARQEDEAAHVREWMESRVDIEEVGKRKLEACWTARDEKLKGFHVAMEYDERHFFAKLLHWLRYRDASVKCLLPLWVKGLFRCLQWKWRQRHAAH